MKKLLLIIALFIGGHIHAQNTYNKFQWQANPVIHKIDTAFKDAAAVYVADDRIAEYVMEKAGFFQYRTLHRIVHINSDKGIESFNKIYLPFDEGLEMEDVKARTILPNGRIIELDRNNIKDLKDDDGQYKIFALEGLEKGCEIEYYFIQKRNPSFFGREVLASHIPVMKAHFELIAPEHLFFETKSYNNLPDSKDSINNEKRYLTIDDAQIKEVNEEKYSMYQASLKRVEYKLSYNKAKNPSERMFTWNELAKKVYDIYTSIGDKDKKKIKDLYDDIGIKGTTESEKIVAIENYMKKNFMTREDMSNEDADDLGKVIKGKLASHQTLCKLYAAVMSMAGVNYQIVFTGNRSDYTLDKNFENWNNARNILFYFPSTRKYLAPTELEYRYPWIPPTWAASNGLYCIGTTIGNFTTAIGEIKPILMEDFEHTYSNMDISVRMDKDDALIMDVKQLYGGYTAPNYRVPFVFLPADQQNNVLKELIKFGTNSENIITHSFENREMEQADPYKPFVINASVKSTNMVERAGEKMIVKIGEMIGPQSEMYDAGQRSTPIDVGFPHSLIRTISFTIPDGYKVKNLNDLNINQEVKDNEKESMGFVCNYEQKGNLLKITIKEHYNHIFYSIQQYDQFKKVINAAADFNKVVLILDKAS
jgi:hypothetical protein